MPDSLDHQRPDPVRRGPWLGLLLTALILAACGGGGGSDSDGDNGGTAPRPVPSQIAPASAVQQSGDINAAVAEPPAARVTDASGHPSAGVAVDFAVVAGGGSISASRVLTGADGVAALGSWVLGSQVGNNEVVATVAGIGSVSFLAEGLEGLVLSIDAVRLNQASQSTAGDIDVVAGRAGLLRVVVSANQPNAATPELLVRLTRDGALVREATVQRAGEGVPMAPDLAVETDTWNLLLSAEEIGPGLGVEAILDPGSMIATTAREGFRYPRAGGSAPFAVRSLPPLNLLFIPIHATQHAATGNISAGNLESFLRGTRQWLPAGELMAEIRAQPLTTDIDLRGENALQTLLSDLQAVRTADGATDTYYHGIFPRLSGMRTAGIAYLNFSPNSPNRSALSYDALPGASPTVAHELGHNMGRRHSPCNDPENIDPDFPYADGGIGVTGYDILGDRLRGPAGFTDYMGYCGSNWTSDYTYRALLEWRTGDPRAPSADGGEHGVLLWGTLNSRGVELNPAFSMVARPVLPERGGPHLLRGTAADGQVLFELSFAGAEVPHAADPSERHFTYFVPLSAAELEQLARIELASPHGYRLRLARQDDAVAAVDGEPLAMRMLRHEVAAARLPGGRARIQWNRERHPVAMVRDGESGQVLAIARSGEIELPAWSRAALPELLLSDGVRSRVSIPMELH